MKFLVIICDHYPFGQGELFLDNEVDFLSKHIEEIYVYTCSKNKSNKRQEFQNVKIINSTQNNKLKKFLLTLSCFTNLGLWKEFFSVRKTFGHSPSFTHLKIILKEYIKAKQTSIDLLNIIENQKINISNTVFYSYWNNSLALSLAILKCKFTNMFCISRSHGWDIDFLRHSPPYLPFKRLMLEKLDIIFTISNQSKNLLNNLFEDKYEDKIITARLGSSNNRQPLFIKQSSKIIICSCSVIYSLKRVYLIVDIIKRLTNRDNIYWIHFGDGELKNGILQYAQKEIPMVNTTITGMIPINEILDFYANNYVDLFINVSEIEGIPVSIMEAQSAGIPVVATNVGGTSEIVNNNNGFLIDKDFQTEEVALMIQDYLNSSETEKLSKRSSSYENWKANYDAEVNYSNFIKKIKELNIK